MKRMLPNIDKNNFLKFINKNTGNSCWEWSGAIDPGGYGIYSIYTDNYTNKTFKAHLISWILKYKNIPNNYGRGKSKVNILHKCDNRKCVNPYHLFLGTPKDNIRDCISKNRFNGGLKTKVNHGVVSRYIYHKCRCKKCKLSYNIWRKKQYKKHILKYGREHINSIRRKV